MAQAAQLPPDKDRAKQIREEEAQVGGLGGVQRWPLHGATDSWVQILGRCHLMTTVIWVTVSSNSQNLGRCHLITTQFPELVHHILSLKVPKSLTKS